MAQVLHPRATTTEATRREIQNSQESIKKLAKRFGINPKTVAKWKKRDSVKDQPMGPKNPRSTVLTEDEEEMIVAFRCKMLLPLDDCLYALQDIIPHLTRSSLHRCLKRHGVNRLPETERKPVKKKQFKKYPIGYFHLDICHVRTEQGKLNLFVAIDRTSKFVFAELHQQAKRKDACAFLRRLIEVAPYKIHTILTDNGTQFTHQARKRQKSELEFDKICRVNGIEHRLTKVNHPWTNGQVERMHRSIKEKTVYRYFYQSHEELRQHLEMFLQAYNFGKRLKTLKGRSPYEYICDRSREEPERFHQKPYRFNMGLYI